MTELNEGVTAPSVDSPGPEHDDSCPFCTKDKPKQAKNDLSHDADLLRRNCNSGDALGTAEPGAHPSGPAWALPYTDPLTNASRSTSVRSNPHHAIPARASLKGAYQAPLLDYIEKSRGVITGDIGYEVNARENGIWLPTIPQDFYAGGGAAPAAGIRWGALSKQYPSEQFTIAEAAMSAARRQFHDAHPDYSDEVKGRLEKIRTRLNAKQMKCPLAKDKSKPDVPPPFGLVGMLANLSSTLAGYLTGDAVAWKPPFFTSRHSKAFHEKMRKIALKQRLGVS